jgi:hypothetical protein
MGQFFPKLRKTTWENDGKMMVKTWKCLILNTIPVQPFFGFTVKAAMELASCGRASCPLYHQRYGVVSPLT